MDTVALGLSIGILIAGGPMSHWDPARCRCGLNRGLGLLLRRRREDGV
jgi:hypothetical protein